MHLLSSWLYRGADKSLARPGRKKAALSKVWSEEWIDLAKVGTGDGLL